MNGGDPALHLYDNLVPLTLTMIDTVTDLWSHLATSGHEIYKHVSA